MHRQVLVIAALVSSGCTMTMPNDGGFESELEILRSGVVVASKENSGLDELLRMLHSEPDRVFSGNGVIPCERHDGELHLLEGGKLPDTIQCSWGSEIVLAGAGDDVIDTGWGDDAIAAGDGNDVVEGSWGNEVFLGGPGDDEIDESWGAAVFLFGSNWGNDKLKIYCDAPAVLIFSREISEQNLVWPEKYKLRDDASQSTIVFEGSLNCIQMIFSDLKIP